MMKCVLKLSLTMSLLAVLAVTSVSAQPAGSMTLKIPFDFVVSNTALPAGDYTIEFLRHLEKCLLIRSSDSNKSAIFLTGAVISRNTYEEAVLVFRRYGDTYFLHQLWMPISTVGYELTQSRRERELVKNFAGEKPQLAFLKVPQSQLSAGNPARAK